MSKLVNRIFRIWAYTVSHSFLLLRSPLKFPDQEGFEESDNYNIDIEFTAVAYMDIAASLNGIEIRQVVHSIPEKFQHFKTSLGYKVFEIKSEEMVYYIVAGSYKIGRSKWTTQSRVSDMKLEYDSIIATSQNPLT